MQITYRNTFSDLVRFQWRNLFRSRIFQAMTAIFVLMISRAVLRALPDTDHLIPIWILTFLIMVLLLVGGYLLLMALITVLVVVSRMDKTLLAEHIITADESGLTEETAFNRSHFSWDGMQKIVRTRRHIFVYVSPGSAHVIPRRAFASQAEWDDFFQGLIELKGKAQQDTPAPLHAAGRDESGQG